MRLERRTEEGPGSTANAPSPAPPFRSPYRPLAVACTLMCFPPLPSLPFPRPLPHRGPPRSAHGTGPFADGEKKGSPAPCHGGRWRGAARRGAARRGAGAPPCLSRRVCAVCAFARKICILRARRGTGPAAGRFALPQLAAPPLPAPLTTDTASAGASAREPRGGSQAVWTTRLASLRLLRRACALDLQRCELLDVLPWCGAGRSCGAARAAWRGAPSTRPGARASVAPGTTRQAQRWVLSGWDTLQTRQGLPRPDRRVSLSLVPRRVARGCARTAALERRSRRRPERAAAAQGAWSGSVP
jgi:hypothetical protein